MNRKAKQLSLALVALAVLAITPAAAKANATLVVMNPVVTVSQGGSAPLIANITNTGLTTLTLTGITVNFTGPSGITFDDSPFFAINPFVLGPGASTGFVPFFDVLAAITVPPELYLGGSFTVQLDCDPPGGPCTGPPVTGDFSINVVAAGPANVPEPATMFLLASGLGGAALARRRAKQKGKTETSC